MRGLHIFIIFFVNNIMLFGVMYFSCIEEKNESFFLNKKDFDFLRKHKISFFRGNKNLHKIEYCICEWRCVYCFYINLYEYILICL